MFIFFPNMKKFEQANDRAELPLVSSEKFDRDALSFHFNGLLLRELNL
jgi:hypothetical protein